MPLLLFLFASKKTQIRIVLIRLVLLLIILEVERENNVEITLSFSLLSLHEEFEQALQMVRVAIHQLFSLLCHDSDSQLLLSSM